MVLDVDAVPADGLGQTEWLRDRERHPNHQVWVGKTALTANLAASTGASGRRVLTVNVDQQGNLGYR